MGEMRKTDFLIDVYSLQRAIEPIPDSGGRVWILFVKIWVNGLWAETHFITINPESVKEMGKALYLAGNCHLKLQQKQRTLNKGIPSPPRLCSNQKHYKPYTLEML